MKPSCDKNRETAAPEEEKPAPGKRRAMRARLMETLEAPLGDPRGPGSARQAGAGKQSSIN